MDKDSEKMMETNNDTMGNIGKNYYLTFEELDAVEALHEIKEELGKKTKQFGKMLEYQPDKRSINKLISGFTNRLKMIVKADGEMFDKATKVEDGVEYQSSDFAYVPDVEKPSTWKLRLVDSSGNVTRNQLGAAAALSAGGFRGNKVKLPSNAITSVKRRIRDEYQKLGVDYADMPDSVKDADLTTGDTKKETNAFMTFKDNNGDLRWLSVYSNKFRDSDLIPEILSEASHLDFVKQIDEKTAEYPELWLWHIKGTRWGVADFIGYDSNGFAIASGTVDKGKEYIAKNLENLHGENLAVSHGFSNIERDSNDPTIITRYTTLEISPLPFSAAANKYTDFIVINGGESVKMLPKDKKQFLQNLGISEDEIMNIESELQKSSQNLHQQGIESKEAETVENDVEPVAETQQEAVNPFDEFAKELGEKIDDLKSEFSSKQEVSDVLKEIGKQIATLSAEIQQLKQGEAIKAQATPAISLMDSFKSVVGNPVAQIDGRTKEAQGPTEAKSVDYANGPTPIPFINAMMNGQ